jgi:hypothetical protein
MRVYINDSQWAAVRALAEGALPTHARLAAILRVGVLAISHRAVRENWSMLDCRAQGVRAAHAELMRQAGLGATSQETAPAFNPCGSSPCSDRTRRGP